MLPSAGTLIDNQYEILSTIGVGGYGVVYQARQINLDRIVALKLLSPNVEEGSDASQRFEREIQIMKNLRHRNLVMVYGSGMWEDSPYLTMEHLDGVSLDRLLAAESKLSTQRAVSIMRQLLDGLAYAHRHGIIHRDLKPSNVVIIDRGAEEVVKLIDFGLAKFLPGAGTAQHVTEAGYAVGSVMYMAPEQCLAQPVDHRSDLYAAGCILQRCLTGEPPYGAEGSTIEVMQQHVLASPNLLTDVLPASIEVLALQMVLSKALAKHAEDRYQSAEVMSADLNLIVSNRSTEISCTDAVPPEGLELPQRVKPSFGKTGLVSVICASIAVVICVLFTSNFFDNKDQSEKFAGKSSTDLFRIASQALQDGDSETAAKYYAAALEKKSDGRLQPLVAIEAYLFLADYYESKKDERGYNYAKEGTQAVIDSRLPVGDKSMTLASVLMRSCNRQLQPRQGLTICDKLLKHVDPILMGGGIERVQPKMIWGYGLSNQPEKGRKILADMHIRKESGEQLNAEGVVAEAEIDFVEGNYKKAIELIEKTRPAKYAEGTALPTLARAYIATGQCVAAQRALTDHRDYYSDRPVQATGAYALVAADQNNFSKAKELIQLVIDKEVTNPEIFTAAHLDFDLMQLAKIAKRAGNDKEARWFLEAYQQAKTVWQRTVPQS